MEENRLCLQAVYTLPRLQLPKIPFLILIIKTLRLELLFLLLETLEQDVSH